MVSITATSNGAANGNGVANGKTYTVTLPAEPPVPWTKPLRPESYVPSHQGFHVEFGQSSGEEAFSSRLVANRTYAPGELLAPLDTISQADVKAYSSVQFGVGPDDHLELNSDLLFMNHSCAPTAEVYLYPRQPEKWEVRAGPKGIEKGGDITFFYPSTEWDMAQGFECGCGAKTCLREIRGAKYLTLEELEARGLVNEHIRELKRSQK